MKSLFALAFDYNSAASNIEIEPNPKFAPVEPIWDQLKLGEMLNKSINTIFADIQKNQRLGLKTGMKRMLWNLKSLG